MGQSKKHLLYLHFKDVFDDFNVSKHSSLCVMAPPIQSHKDIVKVKTFSLENARYNKKHGKEFDLFIRRDISNEATDRILTIKFVSDPCKLSAKTALNESRHLDYAGFTLRVKINKNDTLSDVMDAHLGEEKRYVTSCFRVKLGHKIIAISYNHRNQYRPYYEFMRDNNGDFIILRLKTNPSKGVHLPQYC